MAPQDVAAQAVQAARDAEAEKLRAAAAAASVSDAASTLLSTLVDPPCEIRLLDANHKLQAVNLASTPKKIKKHTSLVQWSEGTNLTTRSTSKYLALELGPSTLVYCKEGAGVMALSKAYKDHWAAYDWFLGYQKFTKGKLPKALVPEGSKRYLTISDPDKVQIQEATLQQVVEAARDSSGLQAAASI